MLKTITIILLAAISLWSILIVDSVAKLLDTGIIKVALFSANDLEGWKSKSFHGETKYNFITENDKSYLQAYSMQSASALYKKIKIDIRSTPYLNWSWRVDQPLPPLQEMEKNGDDYAARVYIVFKTGLTPLSARALNYVWSSNDTVGKFWPNAFTEQAIMIPLRSKQDAPHTWQYEKVNIKEDLLRYFDSLPKYIVGVAIMTDTDNSNNSAIASYGDIYFSTN